MTMKILFIASECAPIAKVGGLADVVGSLPAALRRLGIDVSIVIPFYGSAKLAESPSKFKRGLSVKFSGRQEGFDVWQTFLTSGAADKPVPVYLIQNNRLFAKNIYFEKDATPGGGEKEAASFLFLCAAGVELAKILKTDILHCHDWHTAMTPLLIKKQGLKAKTVLTIHNLQYQGIYEAALVNKLLDENFHGDVNCLKTGILSADIVTTVSPSYAKEILTPEFSAGLGRVLKKRGDSLVGILNGIDTTEFDPQTDRYLKTNYGPRGLENKKQNKEFLQKTCFGGSDEKIPVFGIISRLADQKGFDLVMEIFDSLMKEKLQMVLLGAGLDKYESFFKKKSDEFGGRFFAKIGFDEGLARQIYAGADIFLMPSLFEPCGLGQQIAMRYGTVPVARAIGGIKDTVEDKKSGILFKNYNVAEFLAAVKKALNLFRDQNAWKQMQICGMGKDLSWEKSAGQYLKLYRRISTTP